MRKFIAAIGGLGLGAGLMYLFDPDRGSRRRAQIRDKAQSKLRHARRMIDETARDLANHARGVVADVRSELDFSPIPDVVLEERVRAALGHAVPHSVAHAVQVDAESNRVTLSGQAPASYVKGLIDEADRVHGVIGVNNLLEIVPDLPQLNESTGHNGWTESRSETLESIKWPLAMMMLGVAGAALTYYVQGRTETCCTQSSVGETDESMYSPMDRFPPSELTRIG